jgi:hypothetical protein
VRLRIVHVCVIETFVTDISASTGRNDFIFDIWLLHGDLYRVFPFQVMFAVIKTFVTDISGSTGRNDFIFHIWLLHGHLYRVPPFRVYRSSIARLPCDLELFMFSVIKTIVTDISAST